MAPMPDAPPAPIIALVRDLIFASKISATAKAARIEMVLVRDPARLAGTQGRRLIVDLNLPGAIDAAAAWMDAAGGEVVGFVSHVDTETISRARAAGIANVLARSRFVERLPSLLAATKPVKDAAGE
jgi:hypothetical protein